MNKRVWIAFVLLFALVLSACAAPEWACIVVPSSIKVFISRLLAKWVYMHCPRPLSYGREKRLWRLYHGPYWAGSKNR